MQLPATATEFQGMIEEELRALMAERKEPLYRMMEYQFGWTDDQGDPRPGPPALRLHALFCLTFASVFQGNVFQALPAAVAVELVHLFTQVHDDIQEGNPNRGHRPTVWWLWGPAQAINAGDGLHALARLSLFRMADRGVPAEGVLQATRAMDQACLELFEGQYQDIQFQEQLTVTRGSYLRMAEQRTGALLGCAAELGALLASTARETWEACRWAGHRIGIAMRVTADVAALWNGGGGEDLAGGILSKKKVLPIVYALETAPLAAKREIGTLYMKRVLEPSDLPRIIEILDGVGAREYCEAVAEKSIEEALAALDGTPLSSSGLEDIRQIIGLALQAGSQSWQSNP